MPFGKENLVLVQFSDIPNPAAAAELIKRFKDRFSAKVCLAPHQDCDGKIIAAHTLSLSLMLRPLARDSKVYALKMNLPPREGEQPMALTLRGLRETSVFNGFCAKHDKALFSPIEDSPIICSKEQLFILAYRGVAKEAYLKRKQAEDLTTPDDVRRIHGIEEELVFSDIMLLHQAASLRGAEEVERLKERLDVHLLARDFGRLQTTVFEFSTPLPISASFVYSPDFDFDGNYLQDFEDHSKDLSHLIVTMFPTPTGGLLFLSHEDTANDAPRRLIESLKEQSDISSSVAWLIACQTENFAISPSWYDGLSENDRELFLNGFYCNAEPLHGNVNNLQRNPLKVKDWNFMQAFTI